MGRVAAILGSRRVAELRGNHLARARKAGRKWCSRAVVASLLSNHDEPSGMSRNARLSPAAPICLTQTSKKKHGIVHGIDPEAHAAVGRGGARAGFRVCERRQGTGPATA